MRLGGGGSLNIRAPLTSITRPRNDSDTQKVKRKPISALDLIALDVWLSFHSGGVAQKFFPQKKFSISHEQRASRVLLRHQTIPRNRHRFRKKNFRSECASTNESSRISNREFQRRCWRLTHRARRVSLFARSIYTSQGKPSDCDFRDFGDFFVVGFLTPSRFQV